MTFPVKSPKKLIEVALPLDAINEACAYEKMPGIGAHPRGIHLWWARRPLAAARAVIFSQLVNDPSWKWELEHKGEVPPNQLKASWAASRKKLFSIIKELVKWENSTNEEVLNRARAEIKRSWKEVCELNKEHPLATLLFDEKIMPAFHDPFAGGGAIPLEAQRLGLKTYASDLNPVAVLINKAMIEIPPRFVGQRPIGPVRISGEAELLDIDKEWTGAFGLAEDVRRYALWMKEKAIQTIGNLYPPMEITKETAAGRPELLPLIGKKQPVIAWLWARTVKSPNPAFSHVDVPLVSNFILATKEGKEVYVNPIVKKDSYRFEIKSGMPPDDTKEGTKTKGRGSNFRCLVSGAVISGDYIKAEGNSGRMGVRLMAVVVEGKRGRVYLPPTEDAEKSASVKKPKWEPAGEVPPRLTGGTCVPYGLKQWRDLFTTRQLVALTTFSDLLVDVREKIAEDAIAKGMLEGIGLEDGGNDARAYSEAVSLYLAFAINRCADFNNSVTRWVPGNQKVMNLFAKQAIPMTWDFPEAAILEDTVGGFYPAASYIADCVEKLSPAAEGWALQFDAQTQTISESKTISTDPPYYDNIGYADLSDFFYSWLRPAMKGVFPKLLATIEVPKVEELVATPHRHGGRENAEKFFLKGMTQVIHNLALKAHPEGPVTIYYAFKQSETDDESGTSSTGWDTFLTAVISAGFSIAGTWPLRSEQEFRMVSMGNNALASSIVLVCRKRPSDSPSISRREFIKELNMSLPSALDEMTNGSGEDRSPVAPVDLSQAIIGPGMAIFSKYSSVLEADGSEMSVRVALQLINRFLVEDDFDQATQFCLRWLEEFGWNEGNYGVAEKLATSKGISVGGVYDAGVIESGKGKVRLLKWDEYPSDWNRKNDTRNPVWETIHHLIRALKKSGETSAGALLAVTGTQTEAIRQLAYRLYTLCERKGWADDARAYNELITSWTGIETAVGQVRPSKDGRQPDLFGDK